MGQHGEEINLKISVAQTSITSLSIFIALSMAMVGFLISRNSVEFSYNATVVSASCLVFSIVIFLVALEFFILSIHHFEQIDLFALIGSCLYVLGVMFMVVGISVSIVSFGIQELSVVFISTAFIGYSIYYAVRMWKLSKETYFVARIIFRVVSLLILLTGYVFIFTLGG